MALTVLQVAYTFAPVAPDAVGGAEQVLSIGVLLTLDSRDTSCIYMSAFDPAHARLNLESVLIASAAEDAIARGIHAQR